LFWELLRKCVSSEVLIMLPSIHPHLVCTHVSLIVHAIGAPKAIAPFEVHQVNPEGQEFNLEAEVQQAGQEEPEEEVECPNQEQTSFVKGKPQSILSLPL